MKKQTLSEAQLEFHHQDLKQAQNVLRALNHKMRIQLLRMLHLKPGTTVTELYTKMKLKQSMASQQLAILRSANLAYLRRSRVTVLYFVNYSTLNTISEVCSQLVKHKDLV